MTPHEDRTPWDQKTQEEKAKSVCDHLVSEFISGNLRPVSSETKPKPGEPKPPKPPKPIPPAPTPAAGV
jgi:hypothetical protein